MWWVFLLRGIRSIYSTLGVMVELKSFALSTRVSVDHRTSRDTEVPGLLTTARGT
jgi:hypothetical protein